MAPYRVSSVEASSMALYRVSSAAPWRAIATQPPEARRRERLLEVGLLAGLAWHTPGTALDLLAVPSPQPRDVLGGGSRAVHRTCVYWRAM